jgi:hypothetical protein
MGRARCQTSSTSARCRGGSSARFTGLPCDLRRRHQAEHGSYQRLTAEDVAYAIAYMVTRSAHISSQRTAHPSDQAGALIVGSTPTYQVAYCESVRFSHATRRPGAGILGVMIDAVAAIILEIDRRRVADQIVEDLGGQILSGALSHGSLVACSSDAPCRGAER